MPSDFMDRNIIDIMIVEIALMTIPIFAIIATIGGALGVLLSIRIVYLKDDEKDE